MLGPVDACADIDALLAAVRPPEDPVVGAQVDALRERLTEAEALSRAGKYEDAIAIVEPVLADADTVDYAPLRAEAMFQLGDLQDDAGRWAAAEGTLAEASWLAEKCHHDAVAAIAAATVVYNVGHHLKRFDDAELWARHAEAAVERAGDPIVAAELLANRGLVAGSAGRHAEAETLQREALAARERLLGPNHPDVISNLANIASTVESLGRETEAVEIEREVLRRSEDLYGPDHPMLGIALTNLSSSEAGVGEAKDALVHSRRAEQIFRASLPPDHPHLAAALSNTIVALWMLDEYPEARRVADERLRILQRSLGPEHAEVGEAHAAIGGLAYEMEEYDVARDHMGKALVNLERALGPDHPDLFTALNNLGTADRDAGMASAALEKHERAVALLERAGLQDTDDMALALRGVALDMFALGRTREGLELARRSLAKFASRPASDDQVARTHLEIARAQTTLGDREAAIASAREGLRICPPDVSPQVCADLRTWLAEAGVRD
jgi:serine/threonine-protein kinase